MRQLEVLIAVGRTGTMAKAALDLAISQPVVTKTIADLENSLSVRLFDRSRRGVELTPYGEALFRRSVSLFNDLQASVEELETLADPFAGHLRIGASEAVASGMLSAIIDRLVTDHPRLSFEVTLGGGLTDLQHDELQSRHLDLVIGRLPETVPHNMEVETFYQDRTFLVVGSQSRWAGRRKVDVRELVNEPWCLPPLESYPWSLITEAFQALNMTLPRRVVATRSIDMLTGLVETGNFITLLPQTVLAFRHDTKRLSVLPVHLPIRPYPVGITVLKGRTLSAASKSFFHCAREVCSIMTEEGGMRSTAVLRNNAKRGRASSQG